MDKAKEISALYKDIKQQMGRLVSLCHEIESNAEATADAYQRGYKEAYDTAYADAEEIYESGKKAMYQKGLKDAWEAARTLWNTPTRKEIFGYTTFNTTLTTLTAQETIEKIRQYEQEQEEQIQVGDEVINDEDVRAVTVDMDDYLLHVLDENGVIQAFPREDAVKTGRHFPEIAEVLRKMKENNDNK